MTSQYIIHPYSKMCFFCPTVESLTGRAVWNGCVLLRVQSADGGVRTRWPGARWNSSVRWDSLSGLTQASSAHRCAIKPHKVSTHKGTVKYLGTQRLD